MRKTWTDERLDDFGDHVDRRFDAVDRRFDAVDRRLDEVDRCLDEVDRRFDRVDAELHRVSDRLDGMQRTMVHAAVGMSAAILAGYAALIGLVATQL